MWLLRYPRAGTELDPPSGDFILVRWYKPA